MLANLSGAFVASRGGIAGTELRHTRLGIRFIKRLTNERKFRNAKLSAGVVSFRKSQINLKRRKSDGNALAYNYCVFEMGRRKSNLIRRLPFDRYDMKQLNAAGQ